MVQTQAKEEAMIQEAIGGSSVGIEGILQDFVEWLENLGFLRELTEEERELVEKRIRWEAKVFGKSGNRKEEVMDIEDKKADRFQPLCIQHVEKAYRLLCSCGCAITADSPDRVLEEARRDGWMWDAEDEVPICAECLEFEKKSHNGGV